MYLSGMALTWYHTAATVLDVSASWTRWQESFLEAFPSDHSRDADVAARHISKEDSGMFLEYLFERRRLLFRVGSGESCGSVGLFLLGVLFHLRQQQSWSIKFIQQLLEISVTIDLIVLF